MTEGKRSECTSVSQYTEWLKKAYEKEEYVFYRGQSNTKYNLKPSVLRDDKRVNCENLIYVKVLSECSNDFSMDMSHITILSKMQHYGVPTRLLDITTNALVALYFACDDVRNEDKDGVVFAFYPSEESVKTFDSDTISILSSIPRFTKQEKDSLKKTASEYSKRLQSEDEGLKDKNIREFNSDILVKRLLHEVKSEKPAFENIINPFHLLRNYFIIPKKDNPRIIRQSGAFIMVGLKNAIDPERVKIRKIIIPCAYKHKILKELESLGISKITLHPELYKMAEYITESFLDNIEI